MARGPERVRTVELSSVRVPGTADRLAVYPDRNQRRIVISAVTGEGQIPAAAARSISHEPLARLKRQCQPR